MAISIIVIASSEKRNRWKFLTEPLKSRGHSTTVVQPIPSRKTFQEVCKWLQGRSTPDCFIIVGTGLKPLLALYLATMLGAPVIVRLGGHPLEAKRDRSRHRKSGSPGQRIKLFVNYWFSKAVLKTCRFVVCVNQDLAQRLKNDLRRGAETYVVPQFSSGVAVDRVCTIRGVPQLITVTNLQYMSKAQGVIWLIEQIDAYCRRTGERLWFGVAGDGECKEVVEQFLESFRLTPLFTVELFGFVQNIDDIYRRTDVFLYHSENDGTPNVILEAKRWGIPTIVNDYPAFHSLIKDGESGLIFRNDREFSENLARILTDVELRNALSRGAQFEHETIFSKEAVGVALENAIMSAIHNHAHRQHH